MIGLYFLRRTTTLTTATAATTAATTTATTAATTTNEVKKMTSMIMIKADKMTNPRLTEKLCQNGTKYGGYKI